MVRSLLFYFGTLIAGFIGVVLFAGVSEVWELMGFDEPFIFDLILPVLVSLAVILLFLVLVGRKLQFSLRRTSIIGLLAVLSWLLIIVALFLLIPTRR